jgi:hypothetical protein
MVWNLFVLNYFVFKIFSMYCPIISLYIQYIHGWFVFFSYWFLKYIVGYEGLVNPKSSVENDGKGLGMEKGSQGRNAETNNHRPPSIKNGKAFCFCSW